jgi:hypothetical protein
MWTILEANIALVCACLPMFRILLVAVFPRLFPGSANSRTGANSEGVYGNISEQGTSNLQSVSVLKGRRDSGEEYILQDRDERSRPADSTNGIRKVTQFTIQYDDDGSSQNSTGKSNTKL